MAFYDSEKLIVAKMKLSLCYQKLMNDDLTINLFHLFFFHKSYHITNNKIWTLQNSKNQYNHQVMAFYGNEKLLVFKMTLSLCYQKLMNDYLLVILFHLFFFHKSYHIINNKIWTLQNSKNQYNHQEMAFYGNEKLLVAKMILSLCYQRLMNDDLTLNLFHLFIFHKSYNITNNKIWTLQNSKNQYNHQVLPLCYQKIIYNTFRSLFNNN